eukprot:15339761-Ditylum_brightwellii.AAC.1
MGNTGTTNANIDPIIMLENQEDTTQSDEAENTIPNHRNNEGTPTTEAQKVFLMGLPVSPAELPEGTTNTEDQDAFLLSLPASPSELPDFPEDFNMPFAVVITNPLMNPPQINLKIYPKNTLIKNTLIQHMNRVIKNTLMILHLKMKAELKKWVQEEKVS